MVHGPRCTLHGAHFMVHSSHSMVCDDPPTATAMPKVTRTCLLSCRISFHRSTHLPASLAKRTQLRAFESMTPKGKQATQVAVCCFHPVIHAFHFSTNLSIHPLHTLTPYDEAGRMKRRGEQQEARIKSQEARSKKQEAIFLGRGFIRGCASHANR